MREVRSVILICLEKKRAEKKEVVALHRAVHSQNLDFPKACWCPPLPRPGSFPSDTDCNRHWPAGSFWGALSGQKPVGGAKNAGGGLGRGKSAGHGNKGLS